MLVLDYSSLTVVYSLTSGKSSVPLLSVMIPLDLENGPPSPDPSILSESSVPISTSTVFTKPNPRQVEGIKWALEKGLVVNVSVQCDLVTDESLVRSRYGQLC